MKLLKYIFAPTQFFLSIAWKLFKKCWFVGLIVLYVFRGPLFSKHIIEFIEEQLANTTGMEITIGRFSGTYITGFAFHDIKLEKPAPSLKKLEIKKLAFSYNILAPIVGKRIFRKIELIEPNIELLLQKKINSITKGKAAIDKSKKKHLNTMAKVDFKTLLANAPKIIIKKANLGRKNSDSKLEIKNFTLVISPHDGHISFDGINLINYQQNRHKNINDFFIKWSFINRLLTIYQSKIRIPGYPKILHLNKQIRLDLRSKKTNLANFTIPLPGRAFLNGSIGLKKGCYLHLKQWQTQLSQIMPLVSFFNNKQIKYPSANMALYFDFELPKWNLNRMRGSVALGLSKKAKNYIYKKYADGFVANFSIDNLSIVEKLLQNFNTEIRDDTFRGSLNLQNKITTNKDIVTINGRINSNRIGSSYLKNLKVNGKWLVKTDLKGKQIHIDQFLLNIDKLNVKLRGYVKRYKQIDFRINGQCLSNTIKFLLPSEIKNIINASIKSSWQLAGKIPTDQKQGQFTINGIHKLYFDKLRIQQYLLRSINMLSQFKMSDNNFKMTKFLLNWHKEKIIEANGKLSLDGNKSFFLNTECSVEKIEKYLAMYMPDHKDKIKGSLSAKINTKGNLKNLHCETRSVIQLNNGVLFDIPYQKLKLVAKFELNDTSIIIKELLLFFNNSLVFETHGTIRYKPGDISNLQCKIEIEDLHQFVSNIAKDSLPVHGKLNGRIDINGILSDVLEQKGPLDSNISLNLSNLELQQRFFKHANLDIKGKIGLNKIDLPIIKFNLDEALKACINVSTDYYGKEPAVIKGEFFLQSLSDLLMNKQLQGNLAGRFSLKGKASWLKLANSFGKSLPVNLETKLQIALRKGNIYKIPAKMLDIHANATLNQKLIRLKNLDIFSKNKIILKLIAKLNYIAGDFKLRCLVKIPKIEDYLKAIIPKSMLGGNAKGDIDLHGQLPLNGIPLRCKTNLNLGLFGGKLAKLSCNELRCRLNAQYTQGRIQVKDLQISHNKNLALDANAKISLFNKQKSSIKCNILTHNINSYLSHFVPGKMITGKQFECGIDVNGNLFPFNKMNFLSKVDLLMKNGVIVSTPYNKIVLQKQLSINNDNVNIEKLKLFIDGNNILQATGNIGYHTYIADLQTNFAINNLQKYLPNSDKLNWSGSLQGAWKLKGKLPVKGIDADFISDLGLSLKNGHIGNNKYQKIEFLSQLRGNNKKISFNDVHLAMDKEVLLKIDGEAGYKQSTSTNITIFSNLGKLINLAAPILNKEQSLSFSGNMPLNINLSGSISGENKIEFSTKLAMPVTSSANKDSWQLNSGAMLLAGRIKTGLKTGTNKHQSGIFSEFHFTGPIDNPDIQGKLKLLLPKLIMTEQDLVIRDIDFQVKAQKNDIKFKGTTYLGGSPLTCNGKVTLKNYMPENVDFAVNGDRVLLIRNADMYSRANIDIKLAGNMKNPNKKFTGKLGGKIDIIECNITKNMSLTSSGERVTAPPSFESPFVKLNLGLKILFPNITIKNNLLNITTKGNLEIKGNTATPQIKGWFETESGKLFLPQGVMEIRQCMVRLFPEKPLVPNIEIKAVTQVHDYQVFVLIHGEPENLVIEFTSMPPLPKEDVITLLLTGGTRSELQESAGEKMQETGSFILMQQLLNHIGIGAYVSAQVTGESATITVTPPSWKGVAIQGKVAKDGVRFNVIYRIEFK